MKMATTPRLARQAGFGLALLLCAASASAQLYKWVDANGKTHFTTSPPPPSAKSLQVKAPAQGLSAVELPYMLNQAVRKAPVVLYTSEGCGGCDLGRAFLKRRGIPFVEKTVGTGNDEEKLKEAGSNGQLPLVTIGGKRLIGFESNTWEGALIAATYPAQKMLPADYVYPSPSPAAPPTQVAAVAPPAPRRPVETPAVEKSNAPPGFQF